MLDHKKIGISYVVFGVFCGFIGIFFSALIRIELMVPGHFVFSGSETAYNFTVTSHGILMVFYAAMPIFISGFGNYMIPLMVGCRDMAFPRINNFAFIFFVLSFFMFHLSSGSFNLVSFGFDGGWTLYPPLSIFSDNPSIDLLIISLHFNGVSSILNAINSIITVQFCSSINLWHVGPFVWSLLITSYLILIVMPVLVAGITTLLTDHILGTCFYSVSAGGDPVLFQHLFWFFGHPEVYILILPSFGLVSEFISEYTSVRVLGFKLMVWSMVSIAFLGCLVWAHHMFTVGLDSNTKCYFTIATSLIGLPSGLKIVLWVCSFLNSDIKFNLPVTCAFLFIITFIFGGFTGIILAQSGLDLILHDTYFVVGHFHYILAVSLIYMFFASVYNWYYLLTGIFYNETFARIHVITFFIGSNLAFMPMHILGISGMPRRVFDYPSIFIFWNQVSSFGFILSYLSLFWFIAALLPIFEYFIYSLIKKAKYFITKR